MEGLRLIADIGLLFLQAVGCGRAYCMQKYAARHQNLLELGNRDSGDQLNWTTASCTEEAEGEYIVGSL